MKDNPLPYVTKTEEDEIAQEIIDLLKTKSLPIWQVKDVLSKAKQLADWQTLK